MSAQPKPFPPPRITVAQLQAQVIVLEYEKHALHVDAEKQRARADALLNVCRKIARKTDFAITLETPSLKNADLQDVRRLALNAISDWKE